MNFKSFFAPWNLVEFSRIAFLSLLVVSIVLGEIPPPQ